jgi:hypothetical protein
MIATMIFSSRHLSQRSHRAHKSHRALHAALVLGSALVVVISFLCPTLYPILCPTPLSAQTATTPSQQRPQGAVISGVVTEAASGEFAIGVTVVLSKDSSSTASGTVVRGARTNKFGFYSLPNLPEGTFYLIVQGIGYKRYAKRIVIDTPNEALRHDVPLAMRDVRSGEVTVQAERQSSSQTSMISAAELKADFISKMPSLGGETDIFRVLQLMPGIKSGGEASSGLYIRGGSPDQNLVLLDGVTVYNPSHLGGLLSTFNNDAIRDVRVIKGAFPAEYGGRLSSVVDLTMKEGSKEKLSGAANLSLIAARLTLEGPIGEDASFMISGRRTYFDVLVSALSRRAPALQNTPNYYFYDVNAKLNYKLGENDRIFVSGYFGSDVLTQPTGSPLGFGLDWGNATGSFRWSHIVSPTLFTNFSALYTDYRYGFNIGAGSQGAGGDLGFTTFSQIRDIAVKGDMQYFPSEEHTIKAGIEATYHRFNTTAESSNRAFAAVLADLGNNTINALEAGLYVQDEWQITPQLAANLGLRMSYFQLGNRIFAEPRASLSYEITDDVSLKGAFAVANQFLHLIVRNDISLPTDTWFPATENIKPANSVQYVLGAEANLFDREWLVSVEGYYKSMTNLYEFKDGAAFGLFAPAESQLTSPGVGDAYGVEFFVNKRLGALTGWVGYTLSWTTRTFAELNDGKPFFPRYDRRHDISIVLNYKLNDAWEFGATWQYATGQAFTMPSGQYSFPNFDSQNLIPSQRINYTSRNSFTAPAFHNLGINITHYFTWFNLPFNAGLSIYNAYNRQNPFSVAVSYAKDPTSSVLIPTVTQTSLFPIIPTVSLGFKF